MNAEQCYALTLNAGSSSVKFGLFDIGGSAEPVSLAMGAVGSIGGQPHLKLRDANGSPLLDRDLAPENAANPGMAVSRVLDALNETHPHVDIAVVGHRIVHGGVAYDAPVEITDATLTELEAFEPFAPLHQPHNLAGVRAAQNAFPRARQIGCFDTSFHRRHPWVNDVFALPREYYEKGVRRYGFHGLSYDYIAGELARLAPDLHAGRTVVAHLGNGASMCAISGGRSVGSTMGFSALDGLPMGTRCGQLDPGVVLYLMDQEGLSAAEISDLLFKRSGLLGLSGVSNDMRELESSDAPEAAQAIEYFVFRIRRELGAMAAVLGGLDGVVFCGGIGENAHAIRAKICAGTEWLGIKLDDAANATNSLTLSSEDSRVKVMAIPTNEELIIARAAARLAR